MTPKTTPSANDGSTPNPEPRSGFSLRQLVVEILESGEHEDLDAAAAEALRRVRSAKKTGDALAQAMRPYVRDVNAQTRRLHRVPPTDASTETAGTPPQERPRRRPGRSPMVARIRDWWRTQLEDLYEGENGLKKLGDFTVTDLKYASELRRAQARHNLARAEVLERLAELLTEHGVATVRELPAGVLADILSGEAA
ncbi:hypothetical protein [Streptomyces synnematoformans]|uniref:Uncharacterized protein n=1 Tax=Streptomyces synnematoformans TaxID=415721 RepID=A0ABN2X9A4_9ACTN